MSIGTRNGSNQLNKYSNAGFDSQTGESVRNDPKFYLDGDKMIPNPA